MDIYEDKVGSLSINDILEPNRRRSWFTSQREDLNFGFSTSVYFLKIQFKNTDTRPLSRIIEVAYPLLDHIQVFLIRNGKVTEESLLGDKFPFSSRIIAHRNFIVPFEIPPNESLEVVFRIKSTSSIQVPLRLLKEKTFAEQNQLRNLIYGMYYGAMVAMVLYNLFVFISVRETRYLFYVLYVLSMAFLLFSMNGFSYQYLWPDNIWWNDKAIAVFIGSVDLFSLLFIRLFLDLPGCKPALDRLSIYLAVTLFSAGVMYCSSVFHCYPYRDSDINSYDCICYFYRSDSMA